MRNGTMLSWRFVTGKRATFPPLASSKTCKAVLKGVLSMRNLENDSNIQACLFIMKQHVWSRSSSLWIHYHLCFHHYPKLMSMASLGCKNLLVLPKTPSGSVHLTIEHLLLVQCLFDVPYTLWVSWPETRFSRLCTQNHHIRKRLDPKAPVKHFPYTRLN